MEDILSQKLNVIKEKLEQLKKLDFTLSAFGVGLQSYKGLDMLSSCFEKIDNEHFSWMDPKTKIKKLIKYDPKDPDQRWGHCYELNPPIGEDKLASFEKKYNISLPAEFRAFYKFLGNGGAGPHYGLYSIESIEISLKNTQSNHLEKEFSFMKKWNEQDLTEGEYFDDNIRSGSFDICHHGCGYYDFLIVSASQKGHVWHDARTTDQGLVFLNNSFLVWYESWLDGAIKAIEKVT